MRSKTFSLSINHWLYVKWTNRFPSLRKTIILKKLCYNLDTTYCGEDKKRNVLETQNMTCWSKLWKGDLLIPQLLCKIQLYRTITSAAASPEKKSTEGNSGRWDKNKQLSCWTSSGSEKWVGLWLPWHAYESGELPPASNQLITAFQLTQQLLIECHVTHQLFSYKRLFAYILITF